MAKKQEPVNGLQALKRELKEKKLQRLYIFHGEEHFLLQHYLGQLRKLLVDPLTESFNYHKLSSENFDMRSLLEAADNLPMMAESTMIWVDDVDIFKLNEADREQLAQLLSDIPEYCHLVFTYETVAWKPDKRLKKLWSAVEKAGSIVEFDRQEPRDLIPWITRHFAARKKTVSPELCAYLIDLTGGTMLTLAGEIDKICAFSGADQIHKSDIDAVVEPVLDAVVFQMTDMLGSGQYGKALKTLQTLFKMQQEPLLILGAIGSHFRRISAARTLLDHGKTSQELMSICGLGDYAARKTMQAAGRFSGDFCRRAAELILETDNKIKTSYDDPQRLLELLVLQLGGDHG